MSKSRETKGRSTKAARLSKKPRRGPRFGLESWEATVGRIQSAAVRLVREEGLDALSWRTLGAQRELGITGTAPLYYFGSKVGLLGAIAEQGFDEVAARLRDVRAATTPGADALVKLSVEYARFGLENPRLYHAIHAAQLWHSGSADEGAGKRNWNQAARSARDAAFAEFIQAVRDAQEIGAVRRASPDIAAQVLTALVAGYLFQTLQENVDSTQSVNTRLEYVASLVQVTLGGLALSP